MSQEPKPSFGERHPTLSMITDIGIFALGVGAAVFAVRTTVRAGSNAGVRLGDKLVAPPQQVSTPPPLNNEG